MELNIYVLSLILNMEVIVNPLYPGTYAGMVGKLDYLQQLGVNAVELLPVHEFNELEYLQVQIC